MVAAPFCRVLELAAHYRLAELPFLVLSLRPSISNSCARRSGARFLAQRMFQATCSGDAGGASQGAGAVTRKRDCAAARPTGREPASAWSSDSNAAAEAQHNVQGTCPKAWATWAKGPLPSSPVSQLWNEYRPLMFLWLPNANSGALERPSWQAVALCRPDQASAV